jgi:hypothetical protein
VIMNDSYGDFRLISCWKHFYACFRLISCWRRLGVHKFARLW